VAIGGLAVKLQGVTIEPTTADNWLLDKTMAFEKLKSCANMQTALNRKLILKNVVVRDSFDLDPHKINSMFVVRKNLDIIERVRQ
jgi:hypothetical protein